MIFNPFTASTHIHVHIYKQTSNYLHEDAEGPPVHRGAVLLPLQQLRRNVLRSAAEGGSAASGVDVLLAEAKVRQRQVPLVVHQHILQLEVSV